MYYNYILKCTDGMFKGRFLYVNTTPDGELFGSGDPEELDLTMCHLGVEGGASLAKALVDNTSLISLNLRYNCIGFGMDRIGKLAAAVGANRSLRWLDMAQNELGEIGGRAFGEAIKVKIAPGSACVLRITSSHALPHAYRQLRRRT